MGSDKHIPPWATVPKTSGRIYLHIEQQGRTKRICIDEKACYTVGRNKDCDIICDHKTCSRLHACLAHDQEGRVHLADINSVHGTFIDGKEIQSGSIAEVILGKTEIRLGGCDWVFSLQKDISHSERDQHSRRDIDDGARSSTSAAHLGSDDSNVRGRRDTWQDRDRECHKASRSSRDGHGIRERRDREGRPDHSERRSQEWHGSEKRSRSHVERSKEPQSMPRSTFSERPAGSDRPFPAIGSGASATAQKKKLLWGNKGGSNNAEKDAGDVFGANRWDAASFSNEADRQKFIKLMGVKADVSQGAPDTAVQHCTAEPEREVLSADQQARVLTDVESHFMQGLRRADGRKVGLGL